MDRAELENFIGQHYSASPEYLWRQYPNYGVFRHYDNRKWFAVIMDIPANKLGLASDRTVNVVNFKCDPSMAEQLHEETGVFPGYHMNKKYWVSIALDGSASDKLILRLLEESYNITAPKIKNLKIKHCE